MPSWKTPNIENTSLRPNGGCINQLSTRKHQFPIFEQFQRFLIDIGSIPDFLRCVFPWNNPIRPPHHALLSVSFVEMEKGSQEKEKILHLRHLRSRRRRFCRRGNSLLPFGLGGLMEGYPFS